MASSFHFLNRRIFLSLALSPFILGCGASDSGPQTLQSETNSIGMDFLLVAPGKFQMGSRRGDNRERPVHEVTVSKSYGLGAMEVTEAQYTQVMGKSPKLKNPDAAINSLSWSQANEFCQRLSNLPAEKTAGRIYRLPTEAEWEFACRAGTTSIFSFGDDQTKVGEHAWYTRNSTEEAHPPGEKTPNPWGFFDMHGNAWEWCQNFVYDYTDTPAIDPVGPAKGDKHVLRGGGWFHREQDCRSSSRFSEDPDSPTKYSGGLRVAFTSN